MATYQKILKLTRAGNPVLREKMPELSVDEILSEEIQELIINHATSAQIQEKAQEQGMITMRQDGYFKALTGKTSVAEVNRVAASDSA